ncbi:MAG: hypothetical protein ACRD12_02120 [Acidimicrobiales bacterium]
MNAPPNPDGRPGITFHLDSGPSVDPNAREGAPTGSCSDGIDNGTDGLIDGADPSCNAALVDYLDGSVENPLPGTNCTDGIDNDGDGKADVADPTAWSATTWAAATSSPRPTPAGSTPTSTP